MHALTISVRSNVEDTRDIMIAAVRQIAEDLDVNGGEQWELTLFDDAQDGLAVDEFISAEGFPPAQDWENR